jgi:hypothetical protein
VFAVLVPEYSQAYAEDRAEGEARVSLPAEDADELVVGERDEPHLTADL